MTNIKSKRSAQERGEMVEALRERYLNGTLDEVLIPEDADLTRLLAALESDPDNESIKQRIEALVLHGGSAG